MSGRKLNSEDQQYLDHMLPWLTALGSFTLPQVERVQGLPRSMCGRIVRHLVASGRAVVVSEGGISLGGRRGTTATRYKIVN